MAIKLGKKSDRIIVAVIGLIAWFLRYLSDEKNMDNGFAVAINTLIIVPIALFVYFYPSIQSKGKVRFWQVFIINLFFGWSILGWVVALLTSIDKSNTKVGEK